MDDDIPELSENFVLRLVSATGRNQMRLNIGNLIKLELKVWQLLYLYINQSFIEILLLLYYGLFIVCCSNRSHAFKCFK